MKKMMSFILIMLLSAFATTTTAKSIYNVDNKASPPQKITAQESTQSTFDMPEAALTANTAVTPFLIPWGCNEMCNLNETSATTGANKVTQYFLGPGDRLASAMLGGQRVLSNNDDNTFTNLCFAATELKNFLGPGDMYVLGTAEQNLYEITLSNNRGTCDNDVNVIRTPTGVTYRTGPGDHCRLTTGISGLSGTSKIQ